MYNSHEIPQERGQFSTFNSQLVIGWRWQSNNPDGYNNG